MSPEYGSFQVLNLKIRVNNVMYAVQATSADEFVCTPAIPNNLVEKIKSEIWNAMVTPGKYAYVVPKGRRRRGGVRGA